MPFEFAFLDWLQQFHNPVLDALAVFLNYAGEHGEIWIAFTLLLLLFRRTRKAGCAMATALVLYLVAGDCILKPLFARPRPCDVNTAITILVKPSPTALLPLRAHGLGFCGSLCALAAKPEVGRPRAGAGGFHRLYPTVPVCALSHRCAGRPGAGLALGALASWIVDGLANKPKKKQSV